MHVATPDALKIPAAFEGVITLMRLHDPGLRVRKSVEKRDLFILERKCIRKPAINTRMRDLSDMHVQARDGYIHVATVHPNWMRRPWNIMRALKTEGVDLWAEGGAAKVSDAMEYEEQWMRETRRRRRMGLYRDIAVDGFNTLNRLNIDGERTRINNPGLPAATEAATA